MLASMQFALSILKRKGRRFTARAFLKTTEYNCPSLIEKH
jgi:hypothetical protein